VKVEAEDDNEVQKKEEEKKKFDIDSFEGTYISNFDQFSVEIPKREDCSVCSIREKYSMMIKRIEQEINDKSVKINQEY